MDTHARGDRVALVTLVRTANELTRLRPGARGTVMFVDDVGTVHVRWDDGSRLGVVPNAGDELRPLTAAELAEEVTS